jgi:hypothetical protein
MADAHLIAGLSAKALYRQLKEILEKWPLYRVFEYMGKEGHNGQRTWNRFGVIETVATSRLPQRLDLYCDNPRCRKAQQWDTEDAKVALRPAFKEVTYKCRNCGLNAVTYFFVWDETTQGGSFQKVGQSPALTHEPPPDLAKRLDKEDLDFYRKALTSRNFSYGVGALAYLRRVVENRIN